MSLELNNAEPMYVLGRLWAICETAIFECNSSVSGTIVNELGIDPLKGWALLHSKFMLHIRNLPATRRQYWTNRVGEVVELLPGAALPDDPQSAERQGVMHLGYHHQRSALRSERP